MSVDHALWSRLSAAGLTAGEIPATEQVNSPWIVRVLLGISGLIAAGFLLAFFGIGFAIVLENHVVSIVVGCVIIAIAYALFRSASDNDFASMFALALSFAGQALVVFGVFSIFDFESVGSLPLLIIAGFELVLARVVGNFIHRVASAYAAALAFSFVCEIDGADFLSIGVLAAAVAMVWLSEMKFGKLHALLAPVGYGLTLALVQVEGVLMYGHTFFRSAGSPPAVSGWVWLTQALAAIALVMSIAVLLRRAEWAPREPRTVLSVIAVLAIAATSFSAPGIATGLMIVVLGFANGNRVLIGIGIVALIAYVSSYYYLLDATLLVKAAVLMATGLALLVTRFLVLRVLFPKGGAHA